MRADSSLPLPRQNSFRDLKTWWTELKNNGPEALVVAIAGNKVDLAEKRAVSTEVSSPLLSPLSRRHLLNPLSSPLGGNRVRGQHWGDLL